MMQVPQDIANTIVDPMAHAALEPVETAYSWLRENAPLAVAEPDGFEPFWAVTRHAHISAISKQNALFRNGDRPSVIRSIATDRGIREAAGGPQGLIRTLVNMDAPEHSKYRRITQSWFMPGNLKSREESIRSIARGFVDRLLANGEQCDFVADLALLYPLHVVMDILGVPEADEPRMLKLTQELFGNTDPELSRSKSADGSNTIDVEAAKLVIADFVAYFNGVTADRREAPREDLASIIANAKIDDRDLDVLEAISYYVLIATAGHDTTSSSVAGAMWALAENPDQFDKVKRNPELTQGLVDEAIRWTTPVKHFMRTATEDTELDGQKIAAGDWLMLCYPSANRDSDVFEAPFEFRVDRSPNNHIAFGYGGHFCLGQHLAKLEMRVLMEELLPRIRSIELAGVPRRIASYFVSGPKTLPLRLSFE